MESNRRWKWNNIIKFDSYKNTFSNNIEDDDSTKTVSMGGKHATVDFSDGSHVLKISIVES